MISNKKYSLADFLEPADKRRLGIPASTRMGRMTNKVRAVETGEFRAPRAGEWYISGAIPEAYRALNNLTSKYHIAKLVRVKLIDYSAKSTKKRRKTRK